MLCCRKLLFWVLVCMHVHFSVCFIGDFFRVPPRNDITERPNLNPDQILRVHISLASSSSIPLRLTSPTSTPMKTVVLLCCAVGAGAFVAPLPWRARFNNCNKRPAVGGGADEVSVFDAGEVAVSWDDYKKQQPNEYKVCT